MVQFSPEFSRPQVANGSELVYQIGFASAGKLPTSRFVGRGLPRRTPPDVAAASRGLRNVHTESARHGRFCQNSG